MDPRTDRLHVRLAELVAALSLGIDLGFGQPMEHVLRQCLIARRSLSAWRYLRRSEPRSTTPRCSLTSVPRGRARAGEVVRGRHSSEIHQVRVVRHAQPAVVARHDASDRRRQPAAAPPACRARVRGVRAPRSRQHDRDAQHFRARVRARAGPAGRRGRRGCHRLRAMGRSRLAGRAERRRDPAGLARRAAGRACRGRPARGRDRRRLRARTRAGREAV
jgi:hypothetical protein